MYKFEKIFFEVKSGKKIEIFFIFFIGCYLYFRFWYVSGMFLNVWRVEDWRLKFDFNFYIKFIDFYFYLMMFSCYLFYMFRGILKGLVIRVRCICLI